MTKKIAIACDHGGYDMKEAIIAHFSSRVEFLDLGVNSNDSVDYPDYADKAAQAIKDGLADQGILICGTGIGISIAANRHNHIRAANCTNTTMARLSREHNNANILALGARTVGAELAFDIVGTFLNTQFADEQNKDGRHARRVSKLS